MEKDLFSFFTKHQAAVVREATARLIPGELDDSSECGHAGAREANIVRYIDNLLGAFAFDPPRIYAWRSVVSDNVEFLRLSAGQQYGWQRRISELQTRYQDGIALLDKHTMCGDFSQASPHEQDRVLCRPHLRGFVELLFRHTIEGMYSDPAYGGNVEQVGWSDIRYSPPYDGARHSSSEVESRPNQTRDIDVHLARLLQNNFRLVVQLMMSSED